MADRAKDLTAHHRALVQLEDYEPYIGAKMIEHLRGKAKPWRDARVAHINLRLRRRRCRAFVIAHAFDEQHWPGDRMASHSGSF